MRKLDLHASNELIKYEFSGSRSGFLRGGQERPSAQDVAGGSPENGPVMNPGLHEKSIFGRLPAVLRPFLRLASWQL